MCVCGLSGSPQKVHSRLLVCELWIWTALPTRCVCKCCKRNEIPTFGFSLSLSHSPELFLPVAFHGSDTFIMTDPQKLMTKMSLFMNSE